MEDRKSKALSVISEKTETYSEEIQEASSYTVETLEEIEDFCISILESLVFYVTEEYGRELVNLLPEEFFPIPDDEEIPDVLETGVQETIEILGRMLGCNSYETSLFEFWFLDVLADGLITAQRYEMSQEHQRHLVNWFCFFIRELEKKFDYETFVENLKTYFHMTAEFIEQNRGVIPAPELIEKKIAYLNAGSEANSQIMIEEEVQKMNLINAAENVKPVKVNTKTQKKKENEIKIDTTGPLILSNLNALIKISSILHNVFADEFTFTLISSFFIKHPLFLEVYSPYEINVPKRILEYHDLFKDESVNQKGKKGKKDDPKDKKGDTKDKKGDAKDKKGDPKDKKGDSKDDPDVQAVEEQEEEEVIDLRDVILPLQAGVEAIFFEELWPPELEKLAKSQKGKKK